MLSKGKGLIVRVSAAFHVLFKLENASIEGIPMEICSEAVIALADFVEMCIQHVAFMAGIGDINEYIASVISGNKLIYIYTYTSCCIYNVYINAEKEKDHSAGSDQSVMAYTLLLPGHILNLSHLLMKKRLAEKEIRKEQLKPSGDLKRQV